MASVDFGRIVSTNGIGFYQAQHIPVTEDTQLYCLLLATDRTNWPESVSFEESWRNYVSVYLFAAPFQPRADDLDLLVENLKISATQTNNMRGIAWIRDTGRISLARDDLVLAIKDNKTGDGANIESDMIVHIAQAELAFPRGTRITPDFEAGTFTLAHPHQRIEFSEGSELANRPKPGEVTLSLGENTFITPGTLLFTAHDWIPRRFFQIFSEDWKLNKRFYWGGEFRFFFPRENEQVDQLVFPLFQPLIAGSFDFDVSLHPLHSMDAAQTYFHFQEGSIPQDLVSNWGYLTNGEQVQFRPEPGSGFCLAKRPLTKNDDGRDSRKQVAYLAPVGRYQITRTSEAASDQPPAQLMCGLSGLEYLRFYDGDVIEFVPGRPAFAPFFNPDTEDENHRDEIEHELLPLTDQFTTSWVRLRRAQPNDHAGRRGYFAQPYTSTNYALFPQMHYASPVSSLVSALDAEDDPTSAFPMALYGGIKPPADSELTEFWPNRDMPVATFQAFEEQVLAHARHQTLAAQKQDGPVFLAPDGSPLSGHAVTPHGLLVALNQGSWQRLVLARSAGELLAFGAEPDGVVNPDLAYALMNTNVFLVINNWRAFSHMESVLNIGGFAIDIRPPTIDQTDFPPEDDPRKTLLIFKYVTGKNLRELAEAPDVWTATDTMVEDVSLAQQALRDAFTVADQANDPSFSYFRDISSDPNWLGVIAINAYVNGNAMPPDLKFLFAGIDGSLRAHHFGVDMNQISTGNGTDFDIQRSALFGAIRFKAKVSARTDESHPYEFAVRDLTVLIKNSVITQFNLEISMTIRELFGREVHLQRISDTAADDDQSLLPDTLYLKGQYEKTGGVGKVTFNLDKGTERHFITETSNGFLRVVDRFAVSGATLVAVDEQASPISADLTGFATKTIRSRLTLSGRVLFRETPFPEAEGLDLFSYGIWDQDTNACDGLLLDGMAFDMQFEMNDAGSRQGDPQITLNLNNVIVRSNPAAIRDGALLKGLPLKLTGFVSGEGGGNSAALTGNPVHSPQLVGHTMSKPAYALRFDLPLGSLGALSSVHAEITATMILGWGPNPSSPDQDGVALLIQLPEASGGAMGFELQGLIKTVFSDANLMCVPYGDDATSLYVLLFNDISLSIFGIKLPPNVIVDFILFSNPENSADSNIAWNLAATQLSEGS